MPAAAIAIPAVISAGASVGQMMSGSKMAKDAKKAIDEYERQTLVNPNEGLQVSTLGADRQREDLARTMATYGNLAAMGGTRGIVSMMPNMISQQIQQEGQIAANLDEQEKQRQYAIAQGNSMVQGMTEQREKDDLLGLGNMWTTGRQETMNGVNNLVQTGLSTASAFANMESGGGGGAGTGAGGTPVSPGAAVTQPSLPATGLATAAPGTLPNSFSVFNNGAFGTSGKTTGQAMFQTPQWMMGMNGSWNPYLPK